MASKKGLVAARDYALPLLITPSIKNAASKTVATVGQSG